MPLKWRRLAATAPQDQDERAELEDMLEKWSPSRRLACLDRLREAAALAWYHGGGADHVRILVGDDAKPAKYVSDEFGLCSIHEGRHYKELSPVVPQHGAAIGGVPNALLGSLWRVPEVPGRPDASDGEAVGRRSSTDCSRHERGTRRWISGLR